MIKLSHSKQQKITSAEIENFETKYRYKLPQNYKDLMLKYNGGHPERRYFNETRVYFPPIKYGATTMESLLNVIDFDYLPKGFYPFAFGGESMFCFDTTQSKSKIFRFDEDGEIEEVCSSFEQFIDSLEDDDD